jgi:hypothetical protein
MRDEPAYAAADELIAALNELLEAERAGAKVALATGGTPSDGGAAELMRTVRADEARWCAMLSRQIRRLGGAPSRKTGAFHAKALAIPELHARLAFLNRGQSWVVRKLDALMPQVRDHDLLADLRRMADSHRHNIALTEAFLQAARPIEQNICSDTAKT